MRAIASVTKEKYLELIAEIQKHDLAYFGEAKPIISDYEYDHLVKELEAIEKAHPEWIVPFSPTQRVGEMATSGFSSVAHTVPMLSLANTYSEEELEDFIQRVFRLAGREEILFCAELKMDGVAVTARYEKGVFVRALTRGDGKKGDDVTANLKTVAALPLRLEGDNPPDVLEVRGEVFMSHLAFRMANQRKEEAGEEPWANPRNAAAGSLKLLDPKEAQRRKLSVVFYGIAVDSSGAVESQFACHEFLHKLGLPSFAARHRIQEQKIDKILAFTKEVEKERHDLGFDIDGVVIKVDSFPLREELGVTGKSPRWAVAYKFAPEQATTKICEITVQVGRTGVLTPVAELEPVLLAGSTISRATLHNKEEIERKDIRVGDTVIIEKGGDVIPKVVEVDMKKRPKSSERWHFPSQCPICSNAVIEKEGEVAIRCPNRECGDQVVRRIAFFASKDAMDIEHMGPKVVQQLVEKGLVKSVADLFALNAEELALLEGFKEKAIDNLLASLDKSRKTTLARLIFALGIQHVGKGIAETLAQELVEMDAFEEVSLEELVEIEGVGEKVAESIVSYFENPEHKKEIDRLFHLGVTIKKEKRVTDHPFSGKTFVLTGTLSKYSRSEAGELIKERGGTLSSSVGKKTDFVLVGDQPGSKYEKAKKLGVTILTEEAFLKLL